MARKLLKTAGAICGGLMLHGCVMHEGMADLAPTDAASPAGISPFAADAAAPAVALMDHVLGQYFASDISARPTVCASLSGDETGPFPADQEQALLARFPQLAPFSRCKWNGSAYEDARNGSSAMVFNAHSLACESTARCTAWAGYMAGNTSSIHALYTMVFEGGAWNFERDPRYIAQ